MPRNVMAWEYGTHEGKVQIVFLWENTRERGNLENLGLDERIVIKWVL
jgi:hypothetical protein